MPTVIPWAKASTVAGAAPARSSAASTAAITPARLVARRGRDLGCVDRAAVEEHRVGEGPADVDSEQHG